MVRAAAGKEAGLQESAPRYEPRRPLATGEMRELFFPPEGDRSAPFREASARRRWKESQAERRPENGAGRLVSRAREPQCAGKPPRQRCPNRCIQRGEQDMRERGFSFPPRRSQEKNRRPRTGATDHLDKNGRRQQEGESWRALRLISVWMACPGS